MKLRDLQLIRWPRGYRRLIRKAAEAEGISMNEWLIKQVSGNLEIPASTEMVGKTTGPPPTIIPGRVDDRHKMHSSRLALNFSELKRWIWQRSSVFRKPVDKYLEHPQPVQVTIPLQGGQTRRLSAIAKLQGGTKRLLTAEFPDKTLPSANEIDTRKQCLVTFRIDGPPVYMPASIESAQDGKRLILKDKGFISASVERRTALRIKASFALEYKRQTQHGFRQSQGIDINTKGIQFQSRDILKSGEILVLNIKLPHPKPYLVLCNAGVVWSKEVSNAIQATGCQFLNLTEQDRDAIADFCLREILRRERSQKRKELGGNPHISE